MNEREEAAAFWGTAENQAYPIEQRLACALKALDYFGTRGLAEVAEAADPRDLGALGHYRQAQQCASMASHFTKHPTDNTAEVVNPAVSAHLTELAKVHAKLAEVGALLLVGAGHSRERAQLLAAVQGIRTEDLD